MKRLSLLVLVLVVTLGAAMALAGHTDEATPTQPGEQTQLEATDQVPATFDAPMTAEKKCGFDSDCPHGKCKSGKCGGCGFDSDCKGWGKCKGGWCGSCGFDSDCKGFGGCSSGKCKKSPY